MRPNSRTAVKKCHASSGTFTAADIALYCLIQGGDVIATAPTWSQVEQVLFVQAHAALRDSVIPLSEWGTINKTDIRLPSGEFFMGLSTDVGVRFQGHHARPGSFLLVILDEAPGVRPDIYESVEGISAGGDVRLFWLGNPTHPSGPFYDVFTSDAPGWERLTISAFESPNLAGVNLDQLLAMTEDELDITERPYLVTRRWVRDRYHEWGPDSPQWQSRVLGQFPGQASDSLIALTWLERASSIPINWSSKAQISIGIDVAGPGEDETAVAVRRGDDLLALEPWGSADPYPEVERYLDQWVPHGLSTVNIDSVGIGWNFYTALARHFSGSAVTVVQVNAGASSKILDDRGNRKFANKKAELYWSFRERCRNGELSGTIDRLAISQLAGVRYKDQAGKIEIESKDDARKRGVKSPDRAEAIVLAYAPLDAQSIIASRVGTVHQTKTVAMAGRQERGYWNGDDRLGVGDHRHHHRAADRD